ncbi:unnamed protein product [Mycena citricolor]|uniref:RRM domain-containing protein n=1 Tax=Mycena citricolor TaxID=2018698 RepID=A0AAD2HKI2_9AGAR|nr:unnamed protein product [Mycena citricolor]CAK5276560.1 unnamed protein product [Mycena citricolor]
MQTENRPSHPQLLNPTIYVGHFPGYVSDAQVSSMFESQAYTGWVRIRSRASMGNQEGSFRLRIDFANLYDAEKALASNHIRHIPGLKSPFSLRCSLSPLLRALKLPENDLTAAPRLISMHTPGMKSTLSKMFDLLRVYGPIYTIRIERAIGLALVQFYTEEHAIAANEKAGLPLQVYDPCIICCSSNGEQLNEEALKTFLLQFGTITKVETEWGDSTFVTFGSPANGKSHKPRSLLSLIARTALTALRQVHGKSVAGKEISATYRTVKPSHPVAGVPDTQPQQPAAGGCFCPSAIDLVNLRAQYDAQLEDKDKQAKKLAAQHEAEVEKLGQELRDAQRALSLAESRLKLMDIERDRPLWEAAKKTREGKARAAAEAAKAEAIARAREIEAMRRKMAEIDAQEAASRAAEADRRERLRQQAAAEKQRREQEEERERERLRAEAARQAREAEEKRHRWEAATSDEVLRCRNRDRIRWGANNWTPSLALQRLEFQIAEFESIKFSEAQPLTFEVIPWPVLRNRRQLGFDDVSWKAAEDFFASAKRLLAHSEYTSLVIKVHRTFHPDKWPGKLLTVFEDGLRTQLKDHVNIVAQAMTPLWITSKDSG